MVLPVNIDSTYADDGDSTAATHQQHHDVIHASLNKLDPAGGSNVTFQVSDGGSTAFTVNNSSTNITAPLFDLQKAGASVFLVNAAAEAHIANLWVNNGGQIVFNSGYVSINVGSGAPTISAAQGSLYIRTDTPTVANQRIYMNTTGSTVWTGIA